MNTIATLLFVVFLQIPLIAQSVSLKISQLFGGGGAPKQQVQQLAQALPGPKTIAVYKCAVSDDTLEWQILSISSISEIRDDLGLHGANVAETPEIILTSNSQTIFSTGPTTDLRIPNGIPVTYRPVSTSTYVALITLGSFLPSADSIYDQARKCLLSYESQFSSVLAFGNAGDFLWIDFRD